MKKSETIIGQMDLEQIVTFLINKRPRFAGIRSKHHGNLRMGYIATYSIDEKGIFTITYIEPKKKHM